MTAPVFHYLGQSRDGRTNRWCLRLPCGYEKEPATTMFSFQNVSCDRCRKEYVVDYNARTMEPDE